MTHEVTDLYRLPIVGLLDYWNPLIDDVWGCGSITLEDVQAATAASSESADLLRDAGDPCTGPESRAYHLSRIRWFMENEISTDDAHPITVDIGLAGYTPFEIVVDGNHRLAAATLNYEKYIMVEIIGDLDKAQAVFVKGVHPDEY